MSSSIDQVWKELRNRQPVLKLSDEVEVPRWVTAALATEYLRVSVLGKSRGLVLSSLETILHGPPLPTHLV
jgi:hypothetical protein